MANLALSCTQVLDPRGYLSAIESGRQLYPAQSGNRWLSWNSGSGKFRIQNHEWGNDARLDVSGDPTSSSGGRIRLNTGANHDCNCFWGAPDNNSAHERQVRGIYFKHYTNGAKFRPRITGVALQYQDGRNVRWVGLRDRWNAKGDYCMYNSGGTLPYEGTSTSNYFWGVAKRGTYDGNLFHTNNWRWSGVLFHYETTWKSGSAINCDVYIKNLRPILDAGTSDTPYYNHKFRVWGYEYK